MEGGYTQEENPEKDTNTLLIMTNMFTILIVEMFFHRCIHMMKLIKLYTLIMCGIVDVNYTLIKAILKKCLTEPLIRLK